MQKPKQRANQTADPAFSTDSLNLLAFLRLVTPIEVVNIADAPAAPGKKLFFTNRTTTEIEPLSINYYSGKSFSISPQRLFEERRNFKRFIAEVERRNAH